jgi:polyisoprenoid-binding protein YceI
VADRAGVHHGQVDVRILFPLLENVMVRLSLASLLSLVLLCVGGSLRAADDYDYDLVHSSVGFKARFLDISWIQGRFNDVSGKFSLDRKDPSKSTFSLTIKADSVDTANAARDEHLRQPDYFDTKQFPTIEFRSTAVKAIPDGYEVAGDFTMHGVTKPVTIKLVGGKEIEAMGKKRVGFATELRLKRSDFNFDKTGIGNIGDEAVIVIDCAGQRD